MTVISGPNEAGKTSWHAALRLALTGVRRGPGPDEGGGGRHRAPSALGLARTDGRSRPASTSPTGAPSTSARTSPAGSPAAPATSCSATTSPTRSSTTGRPDASRWLGLDRESFTAVAAVNQAQIMAVAENAAALQDQMQRAAATRGTDATAAEAIEKLKAFRKEAVGAVRVGATGPLWAAMREQEAADAALAEARRLHADYLDREARLEVASSTTTLRRSAHSPSRRRPGRFVTRPSWRRAPNEPLASPPPTRTRRRRSRHATSLPTRWPRRSTRGGGARPRCSSSAPPRPSCGISSRRCPPSRMATAGPIDP